MVYLIPHVDGLGIDEKNRFLLTGEQSDIDILVLNSLKNNEEITLLQNNKKITRTKLSWILMARHRLYLLDNYKDYIHLYHFVKSDAKNISTKIGVTDDYAILFKMPIYVKESSIEKDRFILIPEFPKYGIDSNGVVVDIVNGNILPVLYKNSPNKDSYPSVRLFSSVSDSIVTRSIHKLMGVTWVENDDWDRYTIVGFKDGDKNNYKASNLEWTNRAGKSINSIEKTERVSIKVFDYATRTTTLHDSIADFYRRLGLTPQNSVGLKMIANGGYDILYGRYEIRFLNDPSNFILEKESISDALKKLRDKQNSQVYVAINLKTSDRKTGIASVLNKDVDITSRRECNVAILESSKSIRNNWIIIKKEDENKDIDFNSYSTPENASRRIKTTKVDTDEVEIHDSITKASDYIIKKSGKHTTKRTVSLNSQKGGIIHGFKIELARE